MNIFFIINYIYFIIFLFTVESFHKHHLEIDLTQACVGELNTILRGDINYPIIYGVGVNIKTGEIFPATFLDRGPDRQLRDARNFMGAQSVNIIYYTSIKKKYKIFGDLNKLYHY